MNIAAAPILDHMAALSDPIRARMLLPLESHELTVSELCAVLRLPQSTVSRHLKTLADDGWVVSRRDGTSRFYAMTGDELDAVARRLWPLIRDQVGGTPGAAQDARRLESVLARRRAKSEAFFSAASGQWDRLRDELFGASANLHALVALADPAWVVGDLGCGTGQVADLLAPHVARIIGVDGSADMLRAARGRLAAHPNVELREGPLEALPLDAGSLDVAIIALVLHHQPDPARVLAEVARVLAAGGRVLIVDMYPHDRLDYQQQMGHVWLGFAEDTMRRTLAGAGFEDVHLRALPVDAEASGPALFAATARRK
jgi:ArsR family transcriptional regulator